MQHRGAAGQRRACRSDLRLGRTDLLHPLDAAQARIYGLPVTAVTDPEGSARGAALLAGHGIGGLDADAIIQGDLKQCKVYRPDPAVMQQHEERFQIYRRLYPALRDAFRGGA